MSEPHHIPAPIAPQDDLPKPRLTTVVGGLIGWVVLVVVTFIASQLLVSLVLSGLVHVGLAWSENSAVDLLIYRVIVYGAMIAMIAGFVWYRYRRVSLEQVGVARFPEWSDIGLSLAGAIVYMLASVVTLTLASKVPGFSSGQTQDLGLGHLFGSELVVAFIVLVVVTPLCEELIFRGFLYGRLRALLPWWFSALVVSVLFGVAHMQWNVGIDVFCLSMVACILREMTGNIWAGVLLHMMKNFLAFLVTFVFIQGISG